MKNGRHLPNTCIKKWKGIEASLHHFNEVVKQNVGIPPPFAFRNGTTWQASFHHVHREMARHGRHPIMVFIEKLGEVLGIPPSFPFQNAKEFQASFHHPLLKK